jgi:hypothetical protein
MNPLLVVTAVRAAIRIGRTAADAFEQYAQERPILIPDAKRLNVQDPVAEIRKVALQFDEFAGLLDSDPELKRLWQHNDLTAVPGAQEVVFAVALRFRARHGGPASHLGAQTGEELAGGIMVAQWAEGKGPVSPWTRIVVSLADVALEYVGSNPEVLGIGGNGEKLIGAIAAALAEVIPDDASLADLGPKHRFAERLAGLVLSSGLKTITERPELVFGEEHLQALLKNSLPPLIAALPEGSVSAQIEWRRLADALVGPAVSAALGTLADRPGAFLGRSFASEKAAGVLVSGLLNAAKDVEVDKRFTKEALITLFRAATAVAAENPELILGDLLDRDLSNPADRKLADTIAVNLFRSVATTLKDRPAPFGEDLGVAVAVAAIEGLKASGPAIFDQDKPWEKVAGTVTGQILDGFAEALGNDAKSLKDTVFNKDRLVELARVVVAQIAITPHLVVDGNEEVKRIVAAVARAMAQDKHLLLTADDWIKIAGVAAQEAALNPGRLFGISDESLAGTIASDIIGRLLKTAGDDLVRASRPVGPVMVGETLRDSIIVTLRAIGGNVKQAFENRDAIDDLASALNDAAAEQGLSMGGKEWTRLFRELLPDVLSTGVVPSLTPAEINRLLGK